MSELSANPIDSKEEDLYTIPHPRRSLLGIFISTFFLRVAFGSTTVLMPIYIFQHLKGMAGWGGQFSIIVVEITYALAVIVSSGYFGFRSDTSNSKRWILIGTAAGGIILMGYGICALNWDGWIGITPLVNGLMIFGMSIYHFLHGLAGSCKVNASYGYISRFSVYETRATRIGFYNVFVTGGRAVGVILAGVLYDLIVGVTQYHLSIITFNFTEISTKGISYFKEGFFSLAFLSESKLTDWVPIFPTRLVYLYLLFGFAILISAVIVYFMLDKTRSVVKEEKYSIKKELLTSWRMIKDKGRRGIVLPLLGTASILGILNNWGFLVLSLESTPGAASWTTVLFTLAMGAPMALWGWLADKIGRRKTLWIGVAGLLIMSVMIGIAFFGNYLTGGNPWTNPESQFDASGFIQPQNLWLTILLVISLLMGSAYFPAISGRLGDSSSLGVTDEAVDETKELERTAEFHGATMSIQQTILSISEIIGIIVGGLALMIVYALANTATNFAYNMIGMIVPILILLIFTTIVSFLWPAEEDFIETSKVRRKELS